MLSVRRAICEAGGGGRSYQISIHALREEGDLLIITTQGCKGRISIHALREEGDPIYHGKKCGLSEFLSTPSVRRATGAGALLVAFANISIHALREEGDPGFLFVWSQIPYFYPRPP